MGLRQDHWNPVIFSALRQHVGFWVYPKGSPSELLDGTLKLRDCTTIFTMRFHPWSSPRVGPGGGERWDVTPGHLSDDGSGGFLMIRIQDAEEMEKVAPPFLRRRGSEVGVSRNLFPRLVVG